MAKKQNKNKAKRRFVGLDRNVQMNSEIIEKMSRTDAKTKLEPKRGLYKVNERRRKVQDDESGISTDNERENNKRKQGTIQKKIRKTRRKSSQNLRNSLQENACYEKPVHDTTAPDAVLICPTEIDGETCLEINCGDNEAQLYLSKLCAGSKGSCIHYSSLWLTPNEFQAISGRETAKDWKRSIRHKGRSLKMLISKGLITIQNVSFKKAQENSYEKHHDDTTQQTKSSEDKTTTEAAIDGESVGGGDFVTSKQKIKPDTKPAHKKRGRKPKLLRKTNTSAKIKTLREKVDAVNEGGTQSSEKTDSVDEKHADENESESQNTEDYRPSENCTPEAEQIPSGQTQSEDERRLDQFVKSLRLTKAPAPKQAPDLSPVEKAVKIEASTDDEHQEMPVLQKAEDILPDTETKEENDQKYVSINAESFHPTVTAQPTPPADGTIIDRKTDDDKRIETFKSRLASPGLGLKMTINREKVKVVDADDNVNKSSEDISSGENDKKVNEKSLLLKDALQSAKKYKEQLKKQNSCNPTSKISVHNQQGDHKSAGNSFPQSPSLSGIQKTFVNQQELKTQKEVSKDNLRDQYRRRHFPQLKTHLPSSPLNSVPSVKDVTAMSIQDFLATMSAIYGPLPFSVDTNDAAFAALQEMTRRHEILRLIAHAQANGSLTSSVNPVVAQQLYSLCNIPDRIPLMKPSTTYSKPKTQAQHKQTPPKFDMQYYGISHSPDIHKKDTLLQDAHHHKQNGRVSPFYQGMSQNKRKHSEQVSDCALDLSIKRPKVEHGSLTKTENDRVVNDYDAPLDFSMKRTNDLNPHHNKEISKRATEISSSVDLQYNKHLSVYTNADRKSNLMMCMCGRDDDMTTWSVERVGYFLRDLVGCAQYAKTFHEQGINGRLLPYLTAQHLTKTLGMEVGPALTLMQAVERKSKVHTMSLSPPCQYCRIQQPS